ncbi:MAG TPA: hypothetical protein VG452_00645 [Egibacteraceae bacterium]|nr:LmeA family phospholipid-binding protein [Actinomycetota bacterium]HWB70698.1 hypothetical protein [Egibacteraceae bacterium]
MAASPPSAALRGTATSQVKRSRRSAAALMAAFLVLLGVVALDAAVAGLVERRLAAALGQALGMPVSVDLYGWPVLPRMVAGVMPRARIAGDSGDEGRSPAAFEAWLTAVDVDPRALVDRGRPVAFAASGGRLTATFQDGSGPLGAAHVVATLGEVAARIGPDAAVLRVGSAVVYGSEPGQSLEDVSPALLAARLETVDVQVTDPPVGAHRVAAVAQRGSMQASGEAGGELPLGASSLNLTFEDGVFNGDAAGPLLTADEARVAATQVPWPQSPVSMSRVDATFHDLRVDRRGAGPDGATPLLTSGHATVAVEIDEPAANAVWPLPGQVSFLDETARLTVGPVTLDVEVGAEDGDLVLQPRVPLALRTLVDELPALRLPPMLPHGVVLDEAQVETDLLLLRASGERLEVPVGRGS